MPTFQKLPKAKCRAASKPSKKKAVRSKTSSYHFGYDSTTGITIRFLGNSSSVDIVVSNSTSRGHLVVWQSKPMAEYFKRDGTIELRALLEIARKQISRCLKGGQSFGYARAKLPSPASGESSNS